MASLKNASREGPQGLATQLDRHQVRARAMIDDAAFVAMEDAFYSWWEDVLSHYSDERRKEFEADVAQYVVYENFAKSAFMAGVKMERALGKKNSFR